MSTIKNDPAPTQIGSIDGRHLTTTLKLYVIQIIPRSARNTIVGWAKAVFAVPNIIVDIVDMAIVGHAALCANLRYEVGGGFREKAGFRCIFLSLSKTII